MSQSQTENCNELRVSYFPDDEALGQITVRVVAGQFTGAASAWIAPGDIVAFAKSLDRYPLPVEPASIIEAGTAGTLDGRLPPRTHVRVSVTPEGSRGVLVVRADLQTEVWRDEDSDLHQSVVARFRTEYALLERFARGLEGLVSNRIREAVLEGAPG
jgi:hypothetical protein